MLGVIVPARNEEENIANVINNLTGCKVNKENIYVVDNQSSDRTAEIAQEMGVNILFCKDIGYQATLKKGLNELKNKNYQKFLIIDGDNEIGIKSIENCLAQFEKFNLIIGYREKIKRISERIVNKYFNYKYGIRDLMCGVKCGDIKLYNENNILEFGIDFFKFDKIHKNDVCNFQIDLNQRKETRLGNTFFVNLSLIINLIKFLIHRK
tara:strand:- start:331 stop:957 length:627 start_codon:yes stop_codon:yes gene_type:complete